MRREVEVGGRTGARWKVLECRSSEGASSKASDFALFWQPENDIMILSTVCLLAHNQNLQCQKTLSLH